MIVKLDLNSRTDRIVERIMPADRVTPHGFYHPEEFFESLRYSSSRRLLWLLTFYTLYSRQLGKWEDIPLYSGDMSHLNTNVRTTAHNLRKKQKEINDAQLEA